MYAELLIREPTNQLRHRGWAQISRDLSDDIHSVHVHMISGGIEYVFLLIL